jgi:hypothetical protein
LTETDQKKSISVSRKNGIDFFCFCLIKQAIERLKENINNKQVIIGG